jgi:hypothetical protein
MVSVLASRVVDRGFIGDVMVSVLKYSGSDWTLQLHVTNVILSITTTCHWGDIEHYNYMSRTWYWALQLHVTLVILSITTTCHARDIEHYNYMSRTRFWAFPLHITHVILSISTACHARDIEHYNCILHRHVLWQLAIAMYVMVSVFASSEVDRGFEPRSGQTKDYKIGICCFSAKHAALHAKLDFCSDSSLKYQSTDGYVTQLGHFILIPSQLVCSFSLMLHRVGWHIHPWTDISLS